MPGVHLHSALHILLNRPFSALQLRFMYTLAHFPQGLFTSRHATPSSLRGLTCIFVRYQWSLNAFNMAVQGIHVCHHKEQDNKLQGTHTQVAPNI